MPRGPAPQSILAWSLPLALTVLLQPLRPVAAQVGDPERVRQLDLAILT